MHQSLGHIITFTTHGRTDFMDSLHVRDATFWNIHLVSYAAKHISDEKKDDHPEVDWERIANLSRQFLHDPWSVHLEEVWNFIQDELPTLRDQVRHILTERQAK
jgi:uncharacterized protein with HEPN domain